MYIFIIIWILSGLFSMALAQRKERNLLTAFVSGAILGIFSWIYYLCCKEGGAICSTCQKRISKKAIVCPYCQAKIKNSAPHNEKTE